MTLAEAMRKGALTGPQVFNAYLGEGGGLCALTAAWVGAGLNRTRLTSPIVPTLMEHFLELHNRCRCPEPCCDEGKMPLAETIMHLNDGHRWPREAIADWLETKTVVVTQSIAA